MPYRLLTLPLTILLLGCSTPGAHVAASAREALVGMWADDLQACAGIPSRTRRLSDGTELLSYEQQNPRTGGLNLELPVVGAFSIAGSGSYCHALFRVADGQVIGLNFTGDNDDAFGVEGVCAPIVRGCLRNPIPARPPRPVLPPGEATPGPVIGRWDNGATPPPEAP